MPRTKEAISMLKVFARREAKQAEPNTAAKGYALAVLGVLDWMTNPNAICPYQDLEEDLPIEDGGWEEQTLQPGQKVIPVQPQIENKVNLPEYTPPPSGSPLPEEPSRIILPGSYEAEAAKHPWIRQIGEELVSMQDGTRPTDSNAVVVGQGLNDSPVLIGGGEY